METKPAVDRTDVLDAPGETSRIAAGWHRLAPALALAIALVAGSPTMTTAGGQDQPLAQGAESLSDAGSATSGLTAPLGQVASHPGSAEPDRVADFVGGIAARVRTGNGEPIPGELFLLMAIAGADDDARLYDRTPYQLDRDQIHAEVIESNERAVRAIEEITGTDLQMVNFTSAPGGGLSAGVTYAIAYLNIISDGAFTGDLVVAATGGLDPHGYIHPINAITEKTAAARLAGADVLFTPSIPGAELVAVHGTRVVGELFRSRNTGAALNVERRWDRYLRWGMNHPEGNMDIVGIRHIGDVATYLCGAGSAYACDIVDLLENLIIDTSPTTDDATSLDGTRSSVFDDVPSRLR